MQPGKALLLVDIEVHDINVKFSPDSSTEQSYLVYSLPRRMWSYSASLVISISSDWWNPLKLPRRRSQIKDENLVVKETERYQKEVSFCYSVLSIHRCCPIRRHRFDANPNVANLTGPGHTSRKPKLLACILPLSA